MTEIIDLHPHIISEDLARYPKDPIRGQQSDWSKARHITFEELIAQMDAAGVAKAGIVHSTTFYGYDNSYVVDSVAREPGRFTAIGSVDALAPDAVERARYWHGRGISGFRLFTAGVSHEVDASWLTDPRTFGLWDFSAGEGLTMCIQTTPVGLPQVAELLGRFPQVQVILDHCARPRLDDGPPYAAAESLWALARFDNLNLKISPRTFALARGGRSTPQALFGRMVSEFGADRIAFGSNLPANEGTMTEVVADAMDALASLSGADRSMILSGTAKRLYPALAG